MAFCQDVKMAMPVFFHMRRSARARYESTVKLYDVWNKRLVASALAPAVKSLEDLTRTIEKERIKPLGT
jgi:hypothetical protein